MRDFFLNLVTLFFIPIEFQHVQIEKTASRVLTRFSFNLTKFFFYLIWPSLVQDLMEMNVLIKFHKDRMQNITCRVLTRQSLTLDDGWTTDKM